MFPLFLNLTGRLAVVIGGGPVGRRRAAALRSAGARVRLICLEPRPSEGTDSNLEWRTEPYAPSQLDGAALVIAAGPAALNECVVADARSRRIWVNCASDPDQGDFVVPAQVRRGKLLVAVSTGGASPTLTRVLCERLEGEFDAAFGVWIDLLAELRQIVISRVTDTARRRELFEQLCSWHWLERLRSEERGYVREAMLEVVNGL